MKKLIMVAAMLALVVVGVAPAVAAGHHGGFNHFNPNTFFEQFNHRNDFNRNAAAFDPNNFDANNGGGGVSQGFAERNTSGNVNNSFTATSTGDNSNQCVTPLQFGNTGSQQNVQGSLQYGSSSGDLNFTGGSFVFAPTLSASCDQKVQQSSAASSN